MKTKILIEYELETDLICDQETIDKFGGTKEMLDYAISHDGWDLSLYDFDLEFIRIVDAK